MIKKLFILLAALLPMTGARAQSSVGSWEVYANYLSPEQMLETPSKVFCLSSGSLFSFDKNTDELYHYGIHNVLSEANITKIFYNGKEDYLVLAYNTGNIDVIKKDGKVVNLPDIKDAVLSFDRTINDISFGKDRIYVATNFGIVVYDDKRWEVKESGIYEKPVKFVAATDEYIAAYFSGEQKIGILPIDKTIRYYENFVLQYFSTFSGLRGLKGNVFLASNASTFSPKKMVYYPETKFVTMLENVSDANYSGPYETKNGYYIYNTVASGNNIACIKEFDEDYNVTVTKLPSDFSGKSVAMWDNPNEVFVADGNGVSEYSFTESGDITVLRESFKPEAVTARGAGYITASNSGKVYVSAKNVMFNSDWPTTDAVSYINVIENNRLKDITPSGLTFSGLHTSSAGRKDGTFRASYTNNIVEDPDDPDVYYFSTQFDGVFKIKDGKELTYYNQHNSSIKVLANAYLRIGAMDIDGKGNMFVAGGTSGLHMLSAEKRKLNTPLTASDWVSDFPVGAQGWDAVLLACKKSNMVMYSFRNCGQLLCVDTNGTASTSDDKTQIWTSFLDQDGKEWTIGNIYCFTEDNNGQVWVGTDMGVFIIPDPKKLTDQNMRIQRIKVPRNDGTNFADYLLDGEPIYSLAVDGVNRKWIGTANSGAYLVSDNGSKIIEHFTIENSYLPLNKIYAIACDKLSNAVYFGTTAGLVKYNSDAAPASDDYSDVYAYPNPVRPEYNGWITIAGLMDDSLVKIADAAGNVFFQGTSQGGMITWDGCDASGNRVKTGVYYVFASQNGDGTSTGAVTKIVVVK